MGPNAVMLVFCNVVGEVTLIMSGTNFSESESSSIFQEKIFEKRLSCFQRRLIQIRCHIQMFCENLNRHQGLDR